MKLSQALSAIEDFYIPGCVAWWDKQPENLWQKCHDGYEKYILTQPPKEDLEIQTLGFIDAIKECVDRFKLEVDKPKQTDFSDAVVLGPEKLIEWDSIFHKVCYVCDSKEYLTMEPSEENKDLIRVVCRSHKSNQ